MNPEYLIDSFRVKTRDKSYEIQQMNAPTPSFDPLKCEPTDKIVTDESTIPLRIHSNHNRFVVVLS